MWPLLKCSNDSLQIIDAQLSYPRLQSEQAKYADSEERRARCQQVTLALFGASMDFEVQFDLTVKIDRKQRSIWLEAAKMFFGAFYSHSLL